MGRCKQCNVIIRDDTKICPLCQCVIEQEEPGTDVYPDIWLTEKKIKMVGNISFFAILLISAGLGVWNYVVGGKAWCVIPIASMWFAFLILRLVVISSRGYRVKVMGPVLMVLILVTIIDIMTDPFGWSLNYVLPGIILLADLIIVIMMLVNRRRWQSYIIMQIAMIAISLIPLLLWLVDLIKSPVLSLIAFGVSLFLFLGTLIIGDRTARGELKRRFHIR